MVEVLESGRRRMISISGLPGVGKSRLAAEIATRLRAERGWPVLWFGAKNPWVAGEPATPYEPLMRSLRLLMQSAAGTPPMSHRSRSCSATTSRC